MKESTKRILSLMLAFVMVVGLLPGLSVNVSAAEDAHYLMFATDRHANTSVIGKIINNMESAIGENELEYLALGGDMVGSGNTHPEYNSSEVLAEATNAASSLNADNVDIVAGIHDMNVTDDAGIVLPYQGGGAQIYEGVDYYVYGVEEYCISKDSNSSIWSAQAQAFVDWANGDEIDKSKVIFISSHYPLHAKRDDNAGAYYWHQALNTVAAGSDDTVERDIVFFHGHNHTEDSNEYVYNVGDTMSIQSGSSTVSDTIYYTYATAGYLNQNSKATLVTLTDDQIVLTKYGTSGSGTDMTTVERVVTEETTVPETTAPEETTVPETTDPTENGIPEPETATGSGETTTTEEKTVYVLVDTPTAGNQYIIVSSGSAGTGYALEENTTTGSSITINAAGNGIDAPYIETTDETIMWNTASGMTFQSENGGYYLRYNSELTFSTRSSTDWTVGTNTAYTYSNSRYRYLYNNNGTWTTSSSRNTSTSYKAYFYEKQTVEVETTTTASGTYSIAGNPAEVTKVVTNGSTVELGSTLTFTPTPESGSATTTDTSTTATYEIYSDPNGVISGISGNTVTFSGAYGKALVKVSYTTDFGNVTNYITVTATEPTYVLDITSGVNVVTGTTIPVKGVTASTTLQLDTKIQFVDEDGAETVELPEGATIEWHIPEEYQNIATVGHESGLITFKGVDGAFYVTATLTVGGKAYTVGVNISATTSQYATPNDGPADFPEYPNEGAIRFDKTATAVGNFSETGIAQVELSMTGVPYTTGSEIDVVVMLDMTGSMSDNGMEAAELATIAFMEKIVKNEDGSYNENRIAVYAFNSGSSSPYELVSLKKITSDSELATATTAIKTASDKQASGGTPFDEAASKCKDVLDAAKTDGIGNDRQQFCVFMSDGGPTAYRATYNNTNGYLDISNSGSGTSAITTYFSGYSSSTSSSWSFTLPSEYYTDLMKADGVTVYTVGLLLQNKPSNPSPYSSMTASTYDSTTDTLTSIGSHYYFTSRVLKQMASSDDKYIDIFNVNNADKATAAFESIAMSILQAATDVTVEDKITDEYTMIFDIPVGSKAITGVTNDFYIEFGKYALDENHERTTFTSVTKLYLENTNGTLSAKNSTDPVFEQKTIGDKGTLYYWSTNASDGDTGVSITVDGTTYYFVSYGLEEAGYNMTSGAYANGTVDSTTNMSEDLVIATPYFVYNASDKMIYWTVDKLDTYEYTLSYFLYLNNSATEVATDKETDPGPYPTNDHAYITYTNFQGNDCRQVFPIPQLTWNGAQVSYVFYLVNAAGQPINKSGQVVDFANATFITDVYTEAVVWNKAGDTTTGTGELSANWLADDLLPDEYEIYDKQAHYALNVYENADGSTIKNQFTISGGTKDAISESLNTRLELETTANTVSVSTTKVYNTKAGEKISAYGTYTSADDNMKGFDFANTTVAFAVVWQPRLVKDVVVVDYGLDVIINVVQNDILQNKVTGIGISDEAYRNAQVEINTGVSTTSKLGTAKLTTEGNNTISIENDTSVRFSQGDMEFEDAVIFYYETPVEFWEGSNSKEGYMYSSVTVIPATTIYYEDDFVTLKSYSIDGTEIPSTWNDPEDNRAVQAQDRPGASLISGMLDADNNYGYDGAYTNMSQFSMGSSAKITVDESTYGTAEFSFYGTGFDIISLTSYQTGNIVVKVTGPDGYKKNYFVDTFYGYARGNLLLNTYTYVDGNWKLTGSEKVENADSVSATQIGAPVFPEDTTKTVTAYEYEWIVVDSNDPNALYQVPVMKIEDLPYGKYDVKITASYVSDYDHVENSSSYDFYLDAIRIYDPANDGASDEEIRNAYKADGEYLPEYYELRNWLISEARFASMEVGDVEEGIVFIDGAMSDGTTIGAGPTASVTDYSNYGPNNELYLAPGQAVAFNLDAGQDAPDGYVVDTVQIAYKSVGGTAKVKLWDAASDTVSTADEKIVATATDLYYDITAMNGKTVVILNSGAASSDAILSITNVKVTFKEAADAASEPQAVSNFSMLRSVSTYALTAAANTAETVEETGAITAPFTVTTSGVASAIAAMTAEEPEEPTVPSEPEEPTVPSEPEEPTEPEVFDPMVFKVKLNKDRIKVGQNVKVTVTTSSDVEYVIINGEVVDHCTVDWRGVCTWTLQLVGRQVGPVNVEVICCNADDVASDPVTVHFNVKRK